MTATQVKSKKSASPKKTPPVIVIEKNKKAILKWLNEDKSRKEIAEKFQRSEST